MIVAQDNANDAAYNDGWQNGDNGGFGFSNWILASSGSSSQAGQFIGSSAFNASGDGPQNIDTNGKAFGTYANSSNQSAASRGFSVTMQAGNVYRFQLDNGFINNGGAVTAGFYAGNTAVAVIDFIGGNSGGDYDLKDGNTNVGTGLAFTGRGLSYELTFTSATDYTAVLTKLDGSGSFSYNGTTSATIDTFNLFNTNAGNGGNHDAFVNSLEIEAVPEPMTIIALGVGAALVARRRRA